MCLSFPENETNESKEVSSLNPGDPHPAPTNQIPPNIPPERDHTSLGNASILLGSIDIHDVELERLAALSERSVEVDRSDGENTPGSPRVLPTVNTGLPPPQKEAQEEAIFSPRVHGHRRVRSMGSNSTDALILHPKGMYKKQPLSSQVSVDSTNPLSTKSKVLRHRHGHVRQHSLGSVTSDVPLLDIGVVPAHATRGHHREFSLGSIDSDMSLLEHKGGAASAARTRGHRRQPSTGSIGSSVSLLEYRYAKERDHQRQQQRQQQQQQQQQQQSLNLPTAGIRMPTGKNIVLEIFDRVNIITG